MLSKFNTDDYTKILGEAKGLMLEKAMESDLPASANRQTTQVLKQLADSMNWELDMAAITTEKPKISLMTKVKGLLKT